MLKISEIFWSFQGEGLRAGTPSIFLRLAGCSLQCPYCDTLYSIENGRFMNIDFIMSEIDAHKQKYLPSQVVLTGGEPMEQDLSKIVAALKKSNHFISIETNGNIYQDVPIDWWTVAPKDVNDFFIHDKLIDKINEVKLIVNQNLSVDIIKRFRNKGEKFLIFLQPDWYDIDKYRNTFQFYQQCLEEGIPNVRPGIQLHKVYNVK
jgi:organic radical activating enzyme